MNTRNNIKISFGVPTYSIFGAQTKCVMTYEVKLPYMIEKVAELLIDKGYITPMPRICRGYATVHPGDEYDEKKGLKISMAKAEIAAYAAVEKWVYSISENLWAGTHNLVDDFLIKAEKVIRHDEKFLRQF